MDIDLRQTVWQANLDLPRHGLVRFTWGNVSAIDRGSGVVWIKSSGVAYADLRVEDIVGVDLDGNVIAGQMRPSSDTPAHLALYRAFERIGGIVHTHSTWATAWAQAGRDIPCYGTTHADYFRGSIPCTRSLTAEETASAYEYNIGKVIVETFAGIDPLHVPGVLCDHHGPFTWGKDASNAVYHAVVLEEVAQMAALAERIYPDLREAPPYIQERHFQRKHGAEAYYGQPPAVS